HVEHLFDKLKKKGFLEQKQVELMKKYSSLVFEENQKFNLTGFKTMEEIVTELVISSVDCVDFSNVPRGTSIADIGTGSGVPGIPLAIAYPDLEFSLVDSNQKKVSFLNMVKDYLNLVNVKIYRGRVEELARSPEFREVFGGVVSRAMADIFISTELCSSFAAAEGFVYLYISDAQRERLFSMGEHLDELSLEIMSPGDSGCLIDYQSGILMRKNGRLSDVFPRKISTLKRLSLKYEKSCN
ncbi:MAG TPA: 16S rRNA (guanine(527)-N(7))-methyltransferase RsmG, partial [Spirochaetota bacterium]|nr:16S rRNA (guanine(527)-N(7))-methyltransferase RsmG [Spirochaetota bacterium]